MFDLSSVTNQKKEIRASTVIDLTADNFGRNQTVNIEFPRSFLKTLEEPWHLVGIIADAIKQNEKLSSQLSGIGVTLMESRREKMSSLDTVLFTIAAVKLVRFACIALKIEQT